MPNRQHRRHLSTTDQIYVGEPVRFPIGSILHYENQTTGKILRGEPGPISMQILQDMCETLASQVGSTEDYPMARFVVELIDDGDPNA